MYASAARAFISRARVNAARSRLSAVECTFFAVALERISAIDHRRRSASAGGRSRLSTLDSSGAAARIKAPVYRATSAKSRGLTCLVRKSRTTSGRIGGLWKRLPICSQIASHAADELRARDRGTRDGSRGRAVDLRVSAADECDRNDEEGQRRHRYVATASITCSGMSKLE